MSKLTGSFLLIIIYFISTPAMAWFAGGSVGQADFDISGYDTSTTWKVFGGDRFTPLWGAEVAYINMGDFNVSGGPGYVSVEGYELSGMIFHTVGSVTYFGKVGLFDWETQASISGLSVPSDTGTDLTYGVGVLYKHSALPFDLRGEYQYFEDVSTTDIGMWTVGFHFWF